jgi:hypothetical protein
MYGPPTCSQDVAEAREAELETRRDPAGAEPPCFTAEPSHDPDCREGWLGSDDEGRPRPCLTCRPHLIPLIDRHPNARATSIGRGGGGPVG